MGTTDDGAAYGPVDHRFIWAPRANDPPFSGGALAGLFHATKNNNTSPRMSNAWMPLYVGDYLADTARLNTAQHGAYLLLIMDYWRNGPPPDDDETLARITRSSAAEWRKLRRAVIGYFEVIGGAWRHGRIDAELAEATARNAKHAEKARRAASARWGKHGGDDPPSNAPSIPPSNPSGSATSNAQSNAPAMPTTTTTTINPKATPSLSPLMPQNLPPEAWERWRQHRREKGAPISPTEEAMTLAKLQGYADPEAAIDRAITAGLRRIDPPPETRMAKVNGKPSRRDLEAENIARLTGQKRDERTIEGTAERVGATALPALPDRLR